MANGLLSGKFTPDSTFEKGDFRNNMPQYQKKGMKNKKLLNLLKVLSEKKNCTMAQLSIAWMLRKRILLCLSQEAEIRTFRRKF